MRNVTILNFMVDGQFKWILFENCTFEENRNILPFQINLTIISRGKAVKKFEEPDNCDPVLLCTSTDMETIWAWCVVLIHQYFWTRTVWKKKEKNPLDFV